MLAATNQAKFGGLPPRDLRRHMVIRFLYMTTPER